ncbi:MAG: hypothetical protein WBH08_05005 [Methanothrix sp.]|uniref:hypothetical protein n=1 Tax=Methanothrix sp. TaxID=90426 RepID=UPI003BB56E11
MKNNYILLFILLLLNIVSRIPLTPHGRDTVDSAFIWSLANSISISGVISWALHPLSFLGLYPLSYPSGSPIFLSFTSQVTGVSIENTILVYGFILGILGMLGSYIMALKIKDHYLFAFLTSFAFSTAPIFIELTSWSASTRNLFLALFPLFLWAVFWFNKKRTYLNKPILLIIIFGSTLMTSHRISFLITIILLSFTLAKIVWYIKDKPRILYYTNKLSENVRFLILILLFILMFAFQFSGIGFYSGIWNDYQSGALSQGSGLFSLSLNLSTNYIGQIGILIPVGLIGFLILLRKTKKDSNDIFIICLLMLSASILALGIYMAPFLLPIISLLIASGVCKILNILHGDLTTQGQTAGCIDCMSRINKKFPVVLLFICFLASISFSGFMMERHLNAPLGDTGDKTYMTHEPYVGLFLKEQGTRAFLSNDDLISKRIYASTGVPYLDVGINALINSWIQKDELEVQHISLNELSINSDYFLKFKKDHQIEKDFSWIYSHEIQNDASKQILKKYGVNSIVINNKILDEIVGADFVTYHSIFAKSITRSGSRVYDNNKESIYNY